MESELSMMVGAAKALDKEIERLQGEAKVIPFEIEGLELRYRKINGRIIGLSEQRNQLYGDISIKELNDRTRKQKEQAQIVRREEKLREEHNRAEEEKWIANQNRKVNNATSR